MKKIIFLLAMFAMCNSWAKTSIKNPKCGMSKESFVKLEKVTLTDLETVLEFKVSIRKGFVFTIPKNTYIQADGGEKLRVKGAENIVIGRRFRMPESSETRFSLKFPAIDENTKLLDFSQGSAVGLWFIYDIQLNPAAEIRQVPDNMYGKWRSIKTGELILCLYDTVAVYKNAIWEYKTVHCKKKKGEISLSSGGRDIHLKLKRTKQGLSIIEDGKIRLELSHKRGIIASDEKAYDAPILSLDSATYSGYLYKYNARCKVDKLTLLVDDVFSKTRRREFVVPIREDGFFSVKVPLYHPQNVYMTSDFFNITPLFLEPGKELFHVISFAQERSKTLEVMGELACVNNEIKKNKRRIRFQLKMIQHKILSISSHDYVAFVKDYWKDDISKLNEAYASGKMSAKTYQIIKNDMDYDYATEVLTYPIYYKSAFKKKHPETKASGLSEVGIDAYERDDVSFLTNEFVNNQFGLMSRDYSFFVNRLEHSQWLWDNASKSSGPTTGLDRYLLDNPEPTAMQQKIIEMLLLEDSISRLPAEKEYKTMFQHRRPEFYKKHEDTYKVLRDSLNRSIPFDEMVEYLKRNGVKLSDEEQELVAAKLAHEKLDYNQEFWQKYKAIPNDSLTAFYKLKSPYRSASYLLDLTVHPRNKRLLDSLGVEKGLMTDIMFLQEITPNILKSLNPIEGKKLQLMQNETALPFSNPYIDACNKTAIAKKAYMLAHTNAKMHDTPNVENVDLLDVILKPYAGKVVLINIWNTFSGRDKAEIKNSESLKETMAHEDVAFVYITSNSLSEEKWENLTLAIRGEHYRISWDKWQYLQFKFRMNSKQHCLLVDKSGKVIEPAMSYLNDNNIKTRIEAALMK